MMAVRFCGSPQNGTPRRGTLPGDSSTVKGIRYGLAALKNVGVGAMEEVIGVRASAPFASIYDFLNAFHPGLLINVKWKV